MLSADLIDLSDQSILLCRTKSWAIGYLDTACSLEHRADHALPDRVAKLVSVAVILLKIIQGLDCLHSHQHFVNFLMCVVQLVAQFNSRNEYH